MKSHYLVAAVVVVVLTLAGCVPGTPASIPPPASTPPSAEMTPPLSITPAPTERTSPSDRVPRITIDELLNKVNQNADVLIIDTRSDVVEQFFAGHIKGALPVPLAKITEGQWLPPGGKDREIVFYCT